MTFRGATVTITLCCATAVHAQNLRFDGQKAGEAPKGMTCALTGKGRPGSWVVQQDAGAGDRGLVLAQTDTDETSYRFPHCVVNGLMAGDLTLSVRFKPIAGGVDRAAGLVWRYRDPDNYYVVRANALESNVVMYKVEKGKRTDLPLKGAGRTYGMKAPVPSGAWSELKVVARGKLFAIYLNGQKLYEVEDATFPQPGQVGVWTKADSVTHFDDLRASPGPARQVR
jgi:hypothetical protein